MKEFLIANWYYLVLAVVAVAGFISSLCISLKKNKGANIFDSVKAALMENIPLWAIMSEGLTSGTDKKNNVISLGIKLVENALPLFKEDANIANIGNKTIATNIHKTILPIQAFLLSLAEIFSSYL